MVEGGRQRENPLGGQGAVARLEPGDPTTSRRNPNRPPRVGADRPQSHPGRHGHRGAAARATRDPLRLPRVAGRPEMFVDGGDAQCHLVKVGLADHDPAGPTDPRHHEGIRARGQSVGDDPGAQGRGGVLGQDQILDRQRDARQRASRSAGHRSFDPTGGGPRRFIQDRDQRVQAGVLGRDPVQGRLHQVDRGHLPPGYQPARFPQAQVRQLVRHVVLHTGLKWEAE